MLTSCTRRLCFSSGHRVLGHENKCAHLHGHNYVAEITAVGELDSLGRVIDFSVIKEKIGGWLDDNWDHGMIIYSEDGDAIHAISFIPNSKVFILPYNPTAEYLAKYLLEDVCPALVDDLNITIISVRIIETENCWAEAKI